MTESIVAEIAAEMAQMTDRGRVADYIAPLAGVDPVSIQGRPQEIPA